MMLTAGHSEYCAKKIGLLAAAHGGGYGDVKIMKVKEKKQP